jgi:HAD superfamily hydrolase (TIGR01484 family)
MIYPLIIFDLDGTLAESKLPLSKQMALSLAKLLSRTRVAIISGGDLSQFTKQVVSRLPENSNIDHLYLLPTSGAALYEHRNGVLTKIYQERISENDVPHIEEAIRDAAQETGLLNFASPAHGKRIEYRESQVTLSALGQEAPLKEKLEWDPSKEKRLTLRNAISHRLPHFSVNVGGTTSIDITREGIDKAYGIRKICDWLKIEETGALYVGDELTQGGNDFPAFKTYVKTRPVENPAETIELIDSLLAHA